MSVILVALEIRITSDYCILKPSRAERGNDSFSDWIKKLATVNRYISSSQRECYRELLMVQDNRKSLSRFFQGSRQNCSTYISKPSELVAASWLFCMPRTWCCSDPLVKGGRDRKRLKWWEKPHPSCIILHPAIEEVHVHVCPLVYHSTTVVYCITNRIYASVCAHACLSKWLSAYLPCKLPVSDEINIKTHNVV